MSDTSPGTSEGEPTVQAVTGSLGRIEISSVPLPSYVCAPSATYTPTGKVFVLYRMKSDPTGKDWYHAAIVGDDGSDFTEIFSGSIPQKSTANGIRHMPFSDNKRMMLGDYVLECKPDLDHATAVELVEVEYPWNLTSDPLTSHHWSEIIVSPDQEHLAWTTLRTDMTALVFLGHLKRVGERYIVADPTIISSTDALAADPEREGYFMAQPQLGGEVKQFVRGGIAISSVGSGGAPLTDSVIQHLTIKRIEPITRTPGYDETTILSPDERLGIVMTSRASPSTDPAFLGVMPRPHAHVVTAPLAWALYLYTVDGVRKFRPGNIGPVLIDIDRSQNEPDYMGVPVNSDDESWVYVSPMSWHPSGRKAMWMEMLRGTGAEDIGPTLRIRVAHLLDHRPSPAVEHVPTPSAPSYGIAGPAAEAELGRTATFVPAGRIAGKRSGYVEFERSSNGRGSWSALAQYIDYSDDGENLYTGFERSSGSTMDGVVYEADLQLTGTTSGEMQLRATWSGLNDGTRLLFGLDDDGKPQSYGFARYGTLVARVEDMAE